MRGLDRIRLAKQKVQQKVEPAYLAARLRNMQKPVTSEETYIPSNRFVPPRQLGTVSSWKGIEIILADIVERLELKTDSCLEFGVEYGFSTAALSGYFQKVIGVDTFEGDVYSGRRKRSFYEETSNLLAPFDNITLIKSDYKTFIRQNWGMFDLIHIDIIHSYAATYDCGLWSASHSPCILFHDTESYPAVKQAVSDLARNLGKRFYNFKESNGLGILV